MKKIIVTGGAGFIGSHIVDRLINDGHEVVVIDNESADAHDNFYYNDKAVYHKLDIKNYEDIEPLFNGVTYVFHLAAESRIQPTIEKPVEACMVNFIGTANVLESARINSVKRVMYSSTSAAYGLNNEPPLKETMDRDCLNPYSVSKVGGEDLCKMYHTLYGLETIIFRYFNVYGERQPLKGQYAPVIGLFMRQKNNNTPMTIVGDGLQKRDFINVEDVVEANILASICENPLALGQVMNIGTGTNCTILDLAKYIGGEYKFIPDRPSESRVSLADASKAKSLLDWQAKKTLIQYIKENQ